MGTPKIKIDKNVSTRLLPDILDFCLSEEEDE